MFLVFLYTGAEARIYPTDKAVARTVSTVGGESSRLGGS